MEPKILMLDIETAPNLGYIWGLWQKIYNMEMISSNWYVLCWCAKWLNEKNVRSSALPSHLLYKKDPKNDLTVMEELWNLLDEADVVVAHNAINFDIKRVNTRFISHKISPPSPYKIVDTLKIARQHFAFSSNKLDNLGKLLGLGRKAETGGFQLWVDCLEGKPQAWKKMVKYCKRDVQLLEKVYLALMPYASRTPNLTVYTEKVGCPKCGSENVVKRGFAYTNVSKFQRLKCKDCGSWSRERTRVKTKAKILSNIL